MRTEHANSTSIMIKLTIGGMIIALTALVLGTVDAAFAQSAALQAQLANASRIECRFTVMSKGTWDGDGNDSNIEVAAIEIEASFSAIDIPAGTAQAVSRFGSSYIIVRYAEGYLHLMQTIDIGPLYVTTVFASETTDGRMLAVHTRHRYAASSYPDFQERPEMYVGDCAVEN